MKKKNGWLKQEINDNGISALDLDDNELVIELDMINEFLDQLDEPEVLADKWIDDNSVYASSDGVTEEYVHVDDLQNLLVPKQELPVIPKFVAEWIEVAKESGYDLLGVIYDGAYNENVRSWMFEGKKNKRHLNRNKIARAWLDGYTVEKEQKYRVIFPSVDKNGKGFNYLAKDCYHKELWVEDARRDNSRFELTEQEIKDYDERYWAFAVKVEELEE